VNKADRDGVAETVRDLDMMLDLIGSQRLATQDHPTVATRGEAIDELWDASVSTASSRTANGRLELRGLRASARSCDRS